MNGLLAVFRDEFRRIFALRPAFSVLVAGAALYAIFYPQPYLNEALRDVPIAIVDKDGSDSSRALARMIDATPDVRIATSLPDLVSAEREVFARQVSGILLIPANFERDLLAGRASPIALYADASYFLIYQRLSGAVTAVARGFGAEVEATRLIGIGIDPVLAAAATDPMPLIAVPLFNPQGGYASYVLPAAFVLILQQTLLIGVGLLSTTPGAARPRPEDVECPGAVATVLGKLLAYLALEAVIVPLYLIALPYFYGVPRLGSVATLLELALPFVLSVGGLGLVLATIFRSPLTVQLMCAALGLPFFFLAGFAWPTEAIPQAVRLASLLLPSTSAIDALVRAGQLGAPLSDIRQPFLVLWTLTILYAGIAMLLQARQHSAASA